MNGPSTFTDEDPERSLTRRGFIKGTVVAAGAALMAGGGAYALLHREERFAGAIMGASSTVGHLLRDQRLPPPEGESRVGTVIVGAGIAGLSAAWWLKKNGNSDFRLLELEPAVGGNSQHGKNSISAFPWGAHYVPLPGPDAHLVRMLFEELGVIRGYDEQHAPVYEELYLCADPDERLLLQGRWQDGLIPSVGLSEEDERHHDEFFAAMEKYKELRGRDGRRAFSIPLDLSSRDPELLALDRISMADYMVGKGWTSRSLNWYVRYCCRDDFGMGHDKVSAWAGIHYFASRAGTAANADPQTVLTWPEGNGWLVDRLREGFTESIHANSAVYSIEANESGVHVDYLDVTNGRRTRIQAERVIFAAPRFIASRVIRGVGEERLKPGGDLQYTPWLVANVSLDALPGGPGAPLSWDNVSYYSESLGYVVATHQSISMFPGKTVVTYYRPLDEHAPVDARKSAADKTHEHWARMVGEDLENMHPGIKPHITHIDVWIWGHGMISPGIGYLWGDARQRMRDPIGAIHFAHSDISGISMFEEAQYQGVRAADEVLTALGVVKKASS